MIEKTILDYLTSNLDVPVYMERPEEVPDSWVLIEKTGSGFSRRGCLFTAMIAVQSYAPSMYEAAVLNEQVRDLMLAIAGSEGDVTRCELNSDYNFTDTTTKEYRYQAVFDMTHY